MRPKWKSTSITRWVAWPVPGCSRPSPLAPLGLRTHSARPGPILILGFIGKRPKFLDKGALKRAVPSSPFSTLAEIAGLGPGYSKARCVFPGSRNLLSNLLRWEKYPEIHLQNPPWRWLTPFWFPAKIEAIWAQRHDLRERTFCLKETLDENWFIYHGRRKYNFYNFKIDKGSFFW
jgi:hypothetical protein